MSLAKCYVFVFYVLRRTMVRMGNADIEVFGALLAMVWLEGMLFLNVFGILEVVRQRYIPVHPAVAAAVILLGIGLGNYLTLIKDRVYARYDEEFRGISRIGRLVGTCSVYVVFVAAMAGLIVSGTYARRIPCDASTGCPYEKQQQ